VFAAGSVWSAGTGLADDRGLFVNIVAGADRTWGGDLDRPLVLEGRVADPTSSNEVTVTAEVADLLDVEPGDRLAVPTWDRREWEAWLEDRGAYPPFNGPLVDVVVVGIVRLAFDLQMNQEAGLVMIATPAFVARWGPSVGNNDTEIVVALADPEQGTSQLVQSLSTSLATSVKVTSADDSYATSLRLATRALSVGLAVLAVVVGLTGGLVVAFRVANEVREAADHIRPLAALGATPHQRAIILSIPIVLVAIVAAMASIIGAGFASALFPIGSGRLAEPVPGVRLDAPVLVGGVFVVVLMLAVSVYSALRPVEGRSVGIKRVGRAQAIVVRLGPASSVGFLNAVGRRHARSTLAVAAVTIAGLTATVWFSQSLNKLGDRPERWGYTWSSSPELGFAADEYPAALAALIANPSIAGVGRLEFASALIDDRPVVTSTFRTEGGKDVRPHLLSGRLPQAERQIALGERTAKALGVGVGDTVRVASSETDPTEWDVVGLVVPPYLLTTTNAGDGAFTTPRNLELLFAAPSGAHLAIEYVPGADHAQLESELADDPGWVFGGRSHARQPAAIANLVGISAVLRWLVGFFLALGSVVTLLSGARRERWQTRDLIALRAIGFAQRDVRRCLSAEALTVAAIGLALGVCAGLLTGRMTWRLATRELGVVDSQTSPVLVILGVIAISGAATVVASILSIRRSSAAEASLELRAT
jgi:ABC-type lipoprotein release transport system permease subunit